MVRVTFFNQITGLNKKLGTSISKQHKVCLLTKNCKVCFLEFSMEVEGLTFQVKVLIFNPLDKKKKVDHGQKTSLTISKISELHQNSQKFTYLHSFVFWQANPKLSYWSLACSVMSLQRIVTCLGVENKWPRGGHSCHF